MALPLKFIEPVDQGVAVHKEAAGGFCDIQTVFKQGMNGGKRLLV